MLNYESQPSEAVTSTSQPVTIAPEVPRKVESVKLVAEVGSKGAITARLGHAKTLLGRVESCNHPPQQAKKR